MADTFETVAGTFQMTDFTPEMRTALLGLIDGTKSRVPIDLHTPMHNMGLITSYDGVDHPTAAASRLLNPAPDFPARTRKSKGGAGKVPGGFWEN